MDVKETTCVAPSSTKAEYMALASASKESSWLEMLETDLGLIVEKLCTVHCDNEASIRMATTPKITPRNKHIAAHFRYA